MISMGLCEGLTKDGKKCKKYATKGTKYCFLHGKTEKPSKKVAKKPSKKVAKKPSKKVAKKPSKKVAKKPSKKVTKKPSKKVTKKPMNIKNWMEKNKDKHLKISDVDKLKVGDEIEVFAYDRNFSDGLDEFEKGKPYKADKILAHSKFRLIYKGNHIWDIKMPWGTYEHPIEINLDGFKTNWKWTPLHADDMIHVQKDSVTRKHGAVKDFKPINVAYKDLPKSTRVGWRGPMIPWKYVKKAPELYWDYDE